MYFNIRGKERTNIPKRLSRIEIVQFQIVQLLGVGCLFLPISEKNTNIPLFRGKERTNIPKCLTRIEIVQFQIVQKSNQPTQKLQRALNWPAGAQKKSQPGANPPISTTVNESTST